MQPTGSALERLLRPAEGTMPAEYARQVLDLRFSDADRARSRELSEKVQLGTISGDERDELEDLLTANDVLMILQAKARSSLRSYPAA